MTPTNNIYSTKALYKNDNETIWFDYLVCVEHGHECLELKPDQKLHNDRPVAEAQQIAWTRIDYLRNHPDYKYVPIYQCKLARMLKEDPDMEYFFEEEVDTFKKVEDKGYFPHLGKIFDTLQKSF